MGIWDRYKDTDDAGGKRNDSTPSGVAVRGAKEAKRAELLARKGSASVSTVCPNPIRRGLADASERGTDRMPSEQRAGLHGTGNPKVGRPRIEDIGQTLVTLRPWVALGMSRASWYRRKKEGK